MTITNTEMCTHFLTGYLPHNPAGSPLYLQSGCCTYSASTHMLTVEQQVYRRCRCSAGWVSVWPVLPPISYFTSWIKAGRLTQRQAQSCNLHQRRSLHTPHDTFCSVRDSALQSCAIVKQTTRWSESAWRPLCWCEKWKFQISPGLLTLTSHLHMGRGKLK